MKRQLSFAMKRRTYLTFALVLAFAVVGPLAAGFSIDDGGMWVERAGFDACEGNKRCAEWCEINVHGQEVGTGWLCCIDEDQIGSRSVDICMGNL